MKKEQFSRFDVSDYLDSEQAIAEYLSVVMEENDIDLLFEAIGDVAKARGMAQIASTTGLGRESLYKALSSGAKPRFDTIYRVLNSLGLVIKLEVAQKENKSAA